MAYDNPKIFVARSYHSPHDGVWLDLDSAWDASDIMEAIKDAAHGCEEPCIPCVEDIPKACYSPQTCTIDADKLAEWLELDTNDGDIVGLYWDAIDPSADPADILDAFSGTADDGAEFAQNLAEECGLIPKGLPSWIEIDWEASWNCSLQYDYDTAEADGTTYFFRNI